MNIMINSYCNLRCPYCFAENEMSSCDENNMSPESFEEIIDFHKRNGINEMRLIGGEPTIHPYFIYFLKRLAEDDYFQRVHFFSNMAFTQEIRDNIKLIGKDIRISILPNFNSESITGVKYETIKENIRELSKEGMIPSIGINIYKTDFDYTYALDLAEECGIGNIRWSITTPNFKIPKDFDVKAYFQSYADVILGFLKDCHDRGMMNNLDCNGLPMCAFTTEQVVKMIQYNPIMFDRNSCTPIIDISPNLDVFRCFGMSDYYNTKLEADSTTDVLYDKLYEGTKEHSNKLLTDDCETCPIYEREQGCCSCILYRIER